MKRRIKKALEGFKDLGMGFKDIDKTVEDIVIDCYTVDPGRVDANEHSAKALQDFANYKKLTEKGR